jgi:hypothetical protein
MRLPSHGCEPAVSALLVLLALVGAPEARAQAIRRTTRVIPGAQLAPRILPGAVEVGLAGALSIVEDEDRGSIAARMGGFDRMRRGLSGLELEAGYSHDGSLDVLDLETSLGYTQVLGQTSLYPFIALAADWRKEWGPGEQTRWFVGGNFGLRALVSPRAALRAEYRHRRLMDDWQGDYAEHRVLVGLSLLFRNGR